MADKISDVTGISRRDLSESGSSVVDYISSRPLAFSMIGLGLGMLAFSGGRRREADRYYGAGRERGYPGPYAPRSSRSGYEYEEGAYGRSGFDAAYREDHHEGGSQRSTTDSGMVDSARHMAERAGEAVSSAASTVKEKVGDVVDYASEAPGQVRSQARVASYRVQSVIDENPMIAGIAALAVGAILGLSLPETEIENRYMGEASEELSERVKSVAKETSETVKRVAKESGEALKEQSQEAAETVKRGAEEAGREIKTSVTKNVDTDKPHHQPTPSGTPLTSV